jgi:predicted nucleic acid-binding protein
MVAALRSDRGASRQLLISVLDKRIELLISVPLMVEYEAVLTRAVHLVASRLSAQDVSDVLDALATVSTPVTFWFLWRPQLQNPADEMVLETAVNGGADWLVTFNERHLAAAARRFGIQVAAPGKAWKEIQTQNETK